MNIATNDGKGLNQQSLSADGQSLRSSPRPSPPSLASWRPSGSLSTSVRHHMHNCNDRADRHAAGRGTGRNAEDDDDDAVDGQVSHSSLLSSSPATLSRCSSPRSCASVSSPFVPAASGVGIRREGNQRERRKQSSGGEQTQGSPSGICHVRSGETCTQRGEAEGKGSAERPDPAR